MAKARLMCTSDKQYADALRLERKALRAIVGRLIEGYLPYETVRKICYESTRELVTPVMQAPVHRPGIDFLVGEALESMDTLIDELVERPDPRG